MYKFLAAGLTTCLWSASAVAAQSLYERYDRERDVAIEDTTRASYIEKNKGFKAKDGFQPRLTFCSGGDTALCEISQAEHIVSTKYAYRGLYNAQRNLAFCLGDGCNGSVITDKSRSCAWRIVILASGHPDNDTSDITNLKSCLDDSSPIERTAAQTLAKKLFKTVYGKNIGSEWR